MRTPPKGAAIFMLYKFYIKYDASTPESYVMDQQNNLDASRMTKDWRLMALRKGKKELGYKTRRSK